jgi:excisionase family DNA binding protein
MHSQSEANKKGDTSVLTVHDVAGYLHLSEAKVYRLARAGAMPAFRLGKSWRFRKDLLDSWMLYKSGWESTSVAMPVETPPIPA